jgi:lipid-binding SYLF domain-containing protein
MPRASASIQAEITAIEALLSTSQGLYTGVGIDGVSRTINRKDLEARLDTLYRQLDRANGAKMIIRGVVKGLR